MIYREISGEQPPPTPVTAKTYAKYGLPWFDLYDDKLGDIEAADPLKSVKQKDQEKDFASQQNDDEVIKYKMDDDQIGVL